MRTIGVLIAAAIMTALPAIGPAAAKNGFDFEFKDVEGKTLSLDDFQGKALLVVNTATACGFRHQLEHLETLWRDRKDEGLVVIGVASNDFGGQEPREGQEIAKYCKAKYGVTFPLADRTAVVGANAHPFYRWAADEAGAAPRWNFHKYVIGRDGTLVSSFPSSVDPRSAEMALAVTAALKTPVRQDGGAD